MDLLGVAPLGSGPDHSLAGVTRFKEGFGGVRKEYVGSYDLLFNRTLYKAFRLMKS